MACWVGTQPPNQRTHCCAARSPVDQEVPLRRTADIIADTLALTACLVATPRAPSVHARIYAQQDVRVLM